MIAVRKLECSNSDPKVQKVTQQSQNSRRAQIATVASKQPYKKQVINNLTRPKIMWYNFGAPNISHGLYKQTQKSRYQNDSGLNKPEGLFYQAGTEFARAAKIFCKAVLFALVRLSISASVISKTAPIASAVSSFLTAFSPVFVVQVFAT